MLTLSLILNLSLSLASQTAPAYELRSATLLEQQKKFDEANKAYQDLYQRYPDDSDVFKGLCRTYLSLEKYEQVSSLLQKRLEKEPKNRELWYSLSECFVRMGDKAKALSAAQRFINLALEGFSPEANYQRIGRLFSFQGMYKEAIKIYLLVREQKKEKTIFARELADLHQREENYQKAIEEYLNVLEKEPAQFAWVEQKIFHEKEIIGFPQVEKILRREVSEKPKIEKYRRILADLYVKEKEFDKALKEYEIIEDIIGETPTSGPGRTKGLFYLQFAEVCQNEGSFLAAAEAYQKYIKNYPKDVFIIKAKLGLGIVYHKWGKTTEAIKTFENLLSEYPRAKEISAVLFNLGEIYLETLNKPKEAGEFYQRILQKYLYSLEAEEARFRLGECFLRRNDLEKAIDVYQEASPRSWEKTRFQIAECHFYQGKFDEAGKVYQEIVEKFPQGTFVNDALSRLLLIRENKDQNELLERYAKAELKGRQKQFDEAITDYREIMKNSPTSSLTVETQFATASLLKEKGEYPRAMEAFKELCDKFPDSRLAPLAKKEIAQIYLVNLQKKDKAKIELEELILKYPQSIVCEEARQMLSELQRK
ncbi:MAG: tetratricopeptide repeat protein [Candidatus Edwardsbacteria bacterium]